MSLTINTRAIDGHIIVEVSGQLVHGEPCLMLREVTRRLSLDGSRFFVLDLSGISYMDSAGLGLLLSVYATVRNQGGDLKLLNVAPRVRELFKTTRLEHVFQIFEDENSAIAEKRAHGLPS
jgi:anti-sigma B factor antagonist